MGWSGDNVTTLPARWWRSHQTKIWAPITRLLPFGTSWSTIRQKNCYTPGKISIMIFFLIQIQFDDIEELVRSSHHCQELSRRADISVGAISSTSRWINLTRLTLPFGSLLMIVWLNLGAYVSDVGQKPFAGTLPLNWLVHHMPKNKSENT